MFNEDSKSLAANLAEAQMIDLKTHSIYS